MNDVSPPVDPYQGYRALRDDAPVCQLEAGGPWQISRHADVHQVLKDNETYSSEVSIRPPEERGQPTMLFSDPPLHHRLRKLVSSAFKPSHIERQADRITARAEAVLRRVVIGYDGDVVSKKKSFTISDEIHTIPRG